VCANRQHGHAPLSTTTSNARKCCASNPGPTSRLHHSGVESQPASRLLGSQLAPRPPVLLPGTALPRRPTVVAAWLLAPGAFSRRRNVAHSLRSRQNAACDNSAPARKPASATSPTFFASLLSRHPATLLHSLAPARCTSRSAHYVVQLFRSASLRIVAGGYRKDCFAQIGTAR
jgi:hypothetical protein